MNWQTKFYRIIFLKAVFLAISILIAGCKDDSSPTGFKNNDKILIKADAIEVFYGEKIELQAEIIASGNDYSFQWECDDGDFIGSSTGENAIWQAPSKIGKYKCSVVATSQTDTLRTSIELNVTCMFKDDFSKNLDYWETSYCNAWIEDEEVHLKGTNSSYWATLYHHFDKAVDLGYTIQTKMQNLDNFYSDEPYSLYIKVTDPSSGPDGISLKYWAFDFLPNSDSEYNWRITCFVASNTGAGWCLVNDNSRGYSSVINKNDWNNISWTVTSDKELLVKVNNKLLFESDEIGKMEDYFDITVTVDLDRIGFRTGNDEIIGDDIIVTSNNEPSLNIINHEVSKSNGDDEFLRVEKTPKTRVNSNMITLKEFLERK